ncbi:unnamed protein product [Arabidopsis thaliana]|jgi:hypothetical protein|uniref:Uncharacterized protein n=1 Tax=Arabidopsis thaliana TaxID=3702 RepID=Q9LRU9_ARATH|nr:unnamed protein product [Arabidopsis thaliana]
MIRRKSKEKLNYITSYKIQNQSKRSEKKILNCNLNRRRRKSISIAIACCGKERENESEKEELFGLFSQVFFSLFFLLKLDQSECATLSPLFLLKKSLKRAVSLDNTLF